MSDKQKVLLKYKQRDTGGTELAERFGRKTFVEYGPKDYDQEEVVLKSEVEKRIKELKSFSNRNYHTFTYKNL